MVQKKKQVGCISIFGSVQNHGGYCTEPKNDWVLGAGQRTMENATETVTEALIELTRCLRVCRTLLWASQVPLKEYPPRLGGYARHAAEHDTPARNNSHS